MLTLPTLHYFVLPKLHYMIKLRAQEFFVPEGDISSPLAPDSSCPLRATRRLHLYSTLIDNGDFKNQLLYLITCKMLGLGMKEAPAVGTESGSDMQHDALAEVPKSRWERLWPVMACGAGLFSDGYINNVMHSFHAAQLGY